MKNKNTAFFLSMFAIILFVIVAFIFFKKQDNTEQIVEMSKEEVESAVITCDGISDDLEYLQQALETQNKNMCSCISNDVQEQRCIISITNNRQYMQAIDSSDISLCNEVQDSILKQSCVSDVIAKQKYMADLYEKEKIANEEISKKYVNVSLKNDEQ
jgi:hypothetical protein